ncbi:MAG: tetratricopeptide repeat protein, partial [Betaproteobacteria bacterium]|nr:tetratricopeptide repeat protein [Betaproteobacteria bacterium]
MLGRILQRIVRRRPHRGESAALARLARDYLAAGQRSDAIDTLTQLIEEDAHNAEALYLRGTAHLELQNVPAALEDLGRALAFDAGNPRCHYNIGLAHWLAGEAEACKAALEQALRLDPNFHLAHRFLSHMELEGESYRDLIRRIHEHLAPRTYVEIGVFRGLSFALVRPETLALGIDPMPRIEAALGPNQRIFRETSDAFFARRDVRAELNGLPVDLAFIDGLHQFEFALRDFANLEGLCTPDSTLLVHDVYPLNRETSERERKT